MPDAAQPTTGAQCSLDVRQLGSRVDEWRALGREALQARAREPGRVVLRYAPTPAVRARLGRLVELEQHCCPGLDLRIQETATALVLEITGPPDAEPLLALFASDPAG